MKKIDRREFTMKTQERIRHTAIELQKSEKQKTYVKIEKIFDIHYTAVMKWWKIYEGSGYDGLISNLV